MQKSEKKIMACLPLYPPLALLHSLGFSPYVLWDLQIDANDLQKSDKHLQNYVCAVARKLMAFLLSGQAGQIDALFFYNACDTIRNLPEIIDVALNENQAQVPMFRLHVPMTSSSLQFAQDYLKNEIQDLIGHIESRFHITFDPQKFIHSVNLYDRLNQLLRDLEGFMADGRLSFSEFTHLIRQVMRSSVEVQIAQLEVKKAEVASAKPRADHGKPIIVSGILPPPQGICNFVDQTGLRVVGNDIALLARTYGNQVPACEDPSQYYTAFYKAHMPCSTLLYTADRRIEHLMALIKATGAVGFIFMGEKFCEYEYFEWPLLEKQIKQAGLKTLFLEFGIDDQVNLSAYQTRIQAFSEII